jgi:hypothetical protein
MYEKLGKLHIQSAYEAEVISRAAMFGKKDDIKTAFIRHDQLDRTSNESEFLDRVAKYGELVVDKTKTARAIRGLESIAIKNHTFRTVTPREARFFMDVLTKGPERVVPQLELTHMPQSITVTELPAEIGIARRSEQAA